MCYKNRTYLFATNRPELDANLRGAVRMDRLARIIHEQSRPVDGLEALMQTRTGAPVANRSGLP